MIGRITNACLPVKKKYVSVAEDDSFPHVGVCCKLVASQVLLEGSTNMENN
jgi:hypothetical protein